LISFIDGIAIFLVQKPIASLAIKGWITGRSWDFNPWESVFGIYGSGLFYIAVSIFICILSHYGYEEKIPYQNPSLNIDLVLSKDKKWIAEIKQRSNRKQKIIAYSKDGAEVAKKKAKALGLEKCFIDFKSAEEIDKIYEYKQGL
jgi:hypothetical protein